MDNSQDKKTYCIAMSSPSVLEEGSSKLSYMQIRVLARPFPKGTVPFGAPNVPFGSAQKPPFGSTSKPTYF